MSSRLAGVAALLIGAAVLSGPAEAQWDGMAYREVAWGCWLHEHRDFGGDRLRVLANTSRAWIGEAWNDRVSSIRCAPGCRIAVFEHVNFGGRRALFSGRVAWVGDAWNDRISSFRVFCR